MNILPTIAVSMALSLGVAGAAAAQDQSTAQNPAVKSPSDTSNAPLAKGHNSFTKSEARSRIRAAGYANVTGLALDANGLWQAHATRAGQPVNVALDYKGDVAPQ